MAKSSYETLHPLDSYLKSVKSAKITNSDTKRNAQVFHPEYFSSGHKKADNALRYAENMTTYGNHVKNVQTNFDRLYSVYPEMELDSLGQYIFIVRPNLNIYKNDTSLVKMSSKSYEASSAPAADPFFNYMNNQHPYMLKSLTDELDWGHDFIPYLVGRTESLQLPDYRIKTYNLNQPFTNFNLPYAGHALDSMTGGEFDITFREDNELRIHKLFQAWVYYIHNVTRNMFSPKKEYIRDNVIDYATSIYSIVCKPDAETIVHWAKYTGAFPTNVPNNDMSFNLRGGVPNKVSIPFTYFLQESMDPYILFDFNKNAHVTTPSKEGYIPLHQTTTLKSGGFKDYRTSKMKTIDTNLLNAKVDNSLSLPMTMGLGNGIVGCPFIVRHTNGEFHLRWKAASSTTSSASR